MTFRINHWINGYSFNVKPTFLRILEKLSSFSASIDFQI